MKKSELRQKTLFNTWGKYSNPTSTSLSSIKQRDRPSINECNDLIGFDAIDVVQLDDDDEDDNLLAAVAEMDSIDAQKPDDSQNNNVLQCSDVEYLPGFDLESGDVWIYPTNYPVRDYQYDIVDKALYKNTLVTLPTGLGKTFIAAVVMYNFYRWYPQGKVMFMAPTKPLVAQQIEACYNIMGIPESDTAEMTGNMPPIKRESLWASRRVFFLTPQVLQNDLSRGSCKADQVVLLVIDEAHKALGNHAYCQVVREVAGYHRNFRILALSATPGDDIKAVQQVITNLLISQVELRSEESVDIKPYTHDRVVDKIVVPLGDDVGRIKGKFLKVLEGVVGRLYCNRALWQKDPQRVSKYMLLTARDQFRTKNNQQGGMSRYEVGAIEGDFAMCISMYHAYELLLQHGILSFYNFIKAIMDGTKGMARARTELTKNHDFSQAMDELREQVEPPVEEGANTSGLFSQFSPRRQALQHFPRPDPSFKSHPKLLKLEEVVLQHFEKFTEEVSKSCVNTRVMIFSQYRDSVKEITAILSKHTPLVRAMSFVGQANTGKASRGLTQKEQLEVVQRFRRGGYNTLVATCVGEEGLDIGEVDLIVCFDAHASPIRLVQRMGRTGRKRDGRIVILVTEGKEEQVYKRSQRSMNSIHKAVMQGAKSFELYNDNPRMIPKHLTPRPYKMQMSMGTFVGHSKKKRKSDSTGNIQKFMSKPSTSTKKDDGLLTYEELIYWQEHYKLTGHEAGQTPQSVLLRRKSRRSSSGHSPHPVKELSLTEWLPWQTTPSPIGTVTHSRRTQHLVELLEFTELHGGRDEEDETYDLEMMSFLNDEDIIKPKSGSNEGFLQAGGDGMENGGTSGKTQKKTNSSIDGVEETVNNSEDGERERTTKNKQTTSKKAAKRSGKSVSQKQGSKGAKEHLADRRKKWMEFLKPFDEDDQDFNCTEENRKVDDRDPDMEVCIDFDVNDLPRAPPEMGEEVNADVSIEGALVLNDNDGEQAPVDGQEENTSSLDLSRLLPTTSLVTGLVTSRSRQLETACVPTPPPLDCLEDIGPFTQEENLEKMKNLGKMNETRPVLSNKYSLARPTCRKRLQGLRDADIVDEVEDKNGTHNDRKNMFGTSTPSAKTSKACSSVNISSGETPLGKNSEAAFRSKRRLVAARPEKKQVDFAGDSESFRSDVSCNEQNILEADVITGVMDSGFPDDALVNVDFPSVCEEVSVPCEKNDHDSDIPCDLAAELLQDAESMIHADVEAASSILKSTDVRKSRDIPVNPPWLQRTIAKLSAFQHKPIGDDGSLPEKASASWKAKFVGTISTNEQAEREELQGEACHVEARGVESTSDNCITDMEASSGLAETWTEKEKLPRHMELRQSEMFTDDRSNMFDTLEQGDRVVNAVIQSSVELGKCESSPTATQINLAKQNRRHLSLKRSSPKDKAAVVKLFPPDLKEVVSPTNEEKSQKQWPKASCSEAKLNTDTGRVMTVMDSEEDEGDIRPVVRASRQRRRALSSPLSQEFKKLPSKPRDQQTTKKRSPTLSSVSAQCDSDQEFAFKKKVRDVRGNKNSTRIGKGRTVHQQKKKEHQSSETSGKSTKHARLFLDEEAELSGSDINQFSSDESGEEESEEDSFINDASQLTQVTPACNRTQRNRSPVNMAAIYRQSLMSPTWDKLRFRTPLFHNQKNKYKMVYGKAKANSQSESEAEEVNELEDDAEAESDAKEESLLCETGEGSRAEEQQHVWNPAHSPSNDDGSFDESQIGRPMKRVKRKRILDDSLQEEDISHQYTKQKYNNVRTNAYPECGQQEKVPLSYSDRSEKSSKNAKSPGPYSNFPSTFVKPAQGSAAVAGYVRSSSVCTRSELFGGNCKGNTDVSGDFRRADSPPQVETTAVVAPRARVKEKSSETPRMTSLDVSSSLFSDSAIDISDTELLGALDTGDVTDCVTRNKGVRTPAVNHLKEKELREIAAAMTLTDADMSAEISEVPTFNLGFEFFGADDGTVNSSSNFVKHSRAKEDRCVSDNERTSYEFNLNQSAAFGGKPPGNYIAFPGDGKTKMNFTKVVPFDDKQSKQNQTSAGVGRKVDRSKELVSDERKSDSLPKPSRVSPSAQRPINSVHARPQTPMLSPLLTSSQKDKGKLVILVDTREISNSQVVSSLRLKHGMKAEVCQLTSCDYIVSNRMAVERRTVSDISNSNNVQKLVDRLRQMCSLFDRPCVIIEKDRLKPGEVDKNFIKSKGYMYNLACISQTHIKILFSESQEETANLLSELAAIEAKKGAAIVAPTSMSKEAEKVFQFLLSIPKVGYVTALTLSAAHRTLRDVINSSPESLQRAAKNMSASRATEIHTYLRQKFDPNMVTTKK